MLFAELRVTHSLGVVGEVFGLGADLVGHFLVGCFNRPQCGHQLFDLSLVEQALLVVADPGFLTGFIVRMELARQIPKMLAGVVEIDDLSGAGEEKSAWCSLYEYTETLRPRPQPALFTLRHFLVAHPH